VQKVIHTNRQKLSANGRKAQRMRHNAPQLNA